MSVLICGMEMPTNCWDCPCSDKSNGVCEVIVGGAPIWDDRPADCPLVNVPPHGRVIDADKLDYSETDLLGNHIVYMVDIVDAPTIIPASTVDKEGEG